MAQKSYARHRNTWGNVVRITRAEHGARTLVRVHWINTALILILWHFSPTFPLNQTAQRTSNSAWISLMVFRLQHNTTRRENCAWKIGFNVSKVFHLKIVSKNEEKTAFMTKTWNNFFSLFNGFYFSFS